MHLPRPHRQPDHPRPRRSRRPLLRHPPGHRLGTWRGNRPPPVRAAVRALRPVPHLQHRQHRLHLRHPARCREPDGEPLHLRSLPHGDGGRVKRPQPRHRRRHLPIREAWEGDVHHLALAADRRRHRSGCEWHSCREVGLEDHSVDECCRGDYMRDPVLPLLPRNVQSHDPPEASCAPAPRERGRKPKMRLGRRCYRDSTVPLQLEDEHQETRRHDVGFICVENNEFLWCRLVLLILCPGNLIAKYPGEILQLLSSSDRVFILDIQYVPTNYNP